MLPPPSTSPGPLILSGARGRDPPCSVGGPCSSPGPSNFAAAPTGVDCAPGAAARGCRRREGRGCGVGDPRGMEGARSTRRRAREIRRGGDGGPT
eukprot:7019762-Pyramimonas_sp.AAC.1